MAHYRREYPPQEALRRRYDVGYGAGGYPRGPVRRVGGAYGGDYEGVAYRWGAGGFAGGPGYAESGRSRWSGSGRPDAGSRRSTPRGPRGRTSYRRGYEQWMQGAYPAARPGDTRYDGGYLPGIPGWTSRRGERPQGL